MPRYLKLNGSKEPNVRIEKAWITIDIKTENKIVPLDQETYLVQTRVADYIVLLEKMISGELPQLPKKKKSNRN